MHPVAKHSVVAESSGWHARNVGAWPTRTAMYGAAWNRKQID